MKRMMKAMSGIVLAGMSLPVIVGGGIVVLALVFFLIAWILSLFGIELWPIPQ
jgi:hypothetical protein